MIGAGYYAEVEVDELGGRASLALLDENDGSERQRERTIRERICGPALADIVLRLERAA